MRAEFNFIVFVISAILVAVCASFKKRLDFVYESYVYWTAHHCDS